MTGERSHGSRFFINSQKLHQNRKLNKNKSHEMQPSMLCLRDVSSFQYSKFNEYNQYYWNKIPSMFWENQNRRGYIIPSSKIVSNKNCVGLKRWFSWWCAYLDSTRARFWDLKPLKNKITARYGGMNLMDL